MEKTEPCSGSSQSEGKDQAFSKEVPPIQWGRQTQVQDLPAPVWSEPGQREEHQAEEAQPVARAPPRGREGSITERPWEQGFEK